MGVGEQKLGFASGGVAPRKFYMGFFKSNYATYKNIACRKFLDL